MNKRVSDALVSKYAERLRAFIKVLKKTNEQTRITCK